MSKKHSAVFDDVLSGLGDEAVPRDRAGARFLQRSNRVAERLSGELEEKVLRRIDPARARLWARHNRDYDLLTQDTCRELIDGIRSQGRQEFPAIVRETGEVDTPYEVICGARRHFAVSWLRANGHPDIGYLIEVRDLTDEAAFRLADIENRDREDISDYERAVDYLDAVDRYYNGEQKAMAARLEMSPAYLSRFLQLARLPQEIVAAFASIRDLREAHARALKPALGRPETQAAMLAEARALAGQGAPAAEVMKRLLAVTKPPRTAAAKPRVFRRNASESGVKCTRKGRKTTLEFSDSMSRSALEAAFVQFLDAHEAERSKG
ncbi:hypothetical protein JANAI62_37050 [Jannaschia pagri]|uniref:ParB-like N-terminal domain-containing protein n=1 Tax=Jannaschia pagri TaxID=2829797 RepID=A0ABQ4NRS3_9RHOB|nr:MULTISPECIES: ParB/RepB/Spo0J family partition protein [unclassified Jannaschia]GIT93251.1 hypothetical protein JANAI61_37090 [Jannaschia sp. AI_61]GIT97082.1 hypothetical protein JANAI62_37050 [Jannaschia sp. AI_62]